MRKLTLEEIAELGRNLEMAKNRYLRLLEEANKVTLLSLLNAQAEPEKPAPTTKERRGMLEQFDRAYTYGHVLSTPLWQSLRALILSATPEPVKAKGK